MLKDKENILLLLLFCIITIAGFSNFILLILENNINFVGYILISLGVGILGLAGMGKIVFNEEQKTK